MRGLDERIKLAAARILQICYPEQVDFGEVAYEAHALRMREYEEGLYEAPVMFRNEPLLLRAWKAGQDTSLPMCPTHG